MSYNELSEQEQLRRNSLAALRELGIEPYPAAEYPVTATAAEIAADFDPEKGNFQQVSIAGRIMGRRIMGSASFFELQDHTGRIQVYIRRDDICPEGDPTLYNTVFKKLLDIARANIAKISNAHTRDSANSQLVEIYADAGLGGDAVEIAKSVSDPQLFESAFLKTCIHCGQCAAACPYGSVRMLETFGPERHTPEIRPSGSPRALVSMSCCTTAEEIATEPMLSLSESAPATPVLTMHSG